MPFIPDWALFVAGVATVVAVAVMFVLAFTGLVGGFLHDTIVHSRRRARAERWALERARVDAAIESRRQARWDRIRAESGERRSLQVAWQQKVDLAAQDLIEAWLDAHPEEDLPDDVVNALYEQAEIQVGPEPGWP